MTAGAAAGALLGLLALVACTREAPPAAATTPPFPQSARGGIRPGASVVKPALPPSPPPPPDPCAGFKDDIDHLRCQWVLGPERSEFVPLAGEKAPLEVQVECLPVREQPQAYALCIARGHV